MVVLELTAVGTSIGVVLPEEVLQRLNVKQGHRLLLTETQEGYFRLVRGNGRYGSASFSGDPRSVHGVVQVNERA